MSDVFVCNICERDMVSVHESGCPDDRCWNHMGQDYHCFRIGYEILLEKQGTLFGAIAHGDEKHRAWLEQAIGDHFAGRPMQREMKT